MFGLAWPEFQELEDPLFACPRGPHTQVRVGTSCGMVYAWPGLVGRPLCVCASLPVYGCWLHRPRLLNIFSHPLGAHVGLWFPPCSLPHTPIVPDSFLCLFTPVLLLSLLRQKTWPTLLFKPFAEFCGLVNNVEVDHALCCITRKLISVRGKPAAVCKARSCEAAWQLLRHLSFVLLSLCHSTLALAPAVQLCCASSRALLSSLNCRLLGVSFPHACPWSSPCRT